MSWLDRGILIALVFGVWALVLKPIPPAAHSDDLHNCSFAFGSGYGEVDGSDVYIYSADGSVDCTHF